MSDLGASGDAGQTVVSVKAAMGAAGVAALPGVGFLIRQWARLNGHSHAIREFKEKVEHPERGLDATRERVSRHDEKFEAMIKGQVDSTAALVKLADRFDRFLERNSTGGR